MEKIATFLGGTVLTLMGFFCLTILSTFFGALAGWVVGLAFGETILGIAAQLGVRDVTMWQLGAFLGFVGGHLKTKVTTEVKPPKVAQ